MSTESKEIPKDLNKNGNGKKSSTNSPFVSSTTSTEKVKQTIAIAPSEDLTPETSDDDSCKFF